MTSTPTPRTWLSAPDPSAPCTVVAEVAQAHDGSLGMAHSFIDAAARAGADAVKFQTHIAAAESTPAEPWRTRFSRQDETRYDYWRRMEFTPEQWHGLERHAADAGIVFLSSPFSEAAVDLLQKIGVAGWKIASGEITNFPMLDAIGATGLPVMLSTGMSAWAEVDAAVARLRRSTSPLAVLQCSTQYPSPPEMIGLNLLSTIRARYGCAVGLSDHSGTIYPGLAAATIGVQVLEVHLTLSREMFGPDVIASVTPEELKTLVAGVRFIERMQAHPLDKTSVAAHIEPLRGIFMKSVVPLADLPAGTVLERRHLGAKKPGTGIPASEFENVVGRQLARNVKQDVPLSVEDLAAE